MPARFAQNFRSTLLKSGAASFYAMPSARLVCTSKQIRSTPENALLPCSFSECKINLIAVIAQGEALVKLKNQENVRPKKCNFKKFTSSASTFNRGYEWLCESTTSLILNCLKSQTDWCSTVPDFNCVFGQKWFGKKRLPPCLSDT